MNLKMKKITFHINKLIIPLFFLIIGIWTLPWPYYLPAPGLDASWIIGIYKATADNLQFGPDIAFTLGPLGFLLPQYYIDPELWFISLIFAIFVHFFFIYSIALLMVKYSSTWKEYILIAPILIFSIPSLKEYGLLISTGIIFYLVAADKLDKKYGHYLITLASFLLAIVSLIKFNMTMLSVSIILLFLLICLYNKELKKYWYIPIIYLAFFAVLWKMTGQLLINVPIYLFNSYQLSSGYNAMALRGPDEEVLKGLVSLIFIIILFSYSLIKKVKNLFIFIFLNSGMFFLAFKHGFVRHDLHVLGFMATYAILFICIYIIYEKNRKPLFKYISLFLSLLLVTSIYSLSPGLIDDNVLQKVPTYESTFSLISNPSYQMQVLENSKNSIKQYYPLDDKTIIYLNNKSMDIFPWDIALVWAYNFTWSPRPVFHSYGAYTEELDSLNAQHFSKEKAPQVVLYAFKSIDGRYPIFDEPATFAAILKNYTFVKRSGEFLILNHDPKENTPMMEHDLGTVKGVIGQPIKIPEYSSGYVYGQIQLEPGYRHV